MNTQAILTQLNQLSHPENLPGMARFGINTGRALGLSMPEIRRMASSIRKAYPRRDPALHTLAAGLWETGIHEARILAALIDLPGQVTPEQMDHWAAGFDSWDVVDQTCGALFVETPYAVEKAHSWSARPEEYIKRAGFVLMAELAVHAHHLPEEALVGFLPVIEREAWDERNFIKKAENWALRQIGKRSPALNEQAVWCCQRITAQGTRSARWIAADALRELCSAEVQARLVKKPV